MVDLMDKKKKTPPTGVPYYDRGVFALEIFISLDLSSPEG
jgi:hypothetical protein